jgi:hypothetical protein
MLTRRKLITGAAALAAYSQMEDAGAQTTRRVLLGGGVNPVAAALFARMSPAPTAARQALMSSLIGSLQTSGVWASLDAFYVLANFSTQAASLNWISTQYSPLVAINAPTFTTDQGYAGNGTSSYLQTSFNPSSPGIKFAQNNCSLFARSNTNLRQDSGSCVGNASTFGTGPGANINPWNMSLNNGSYALNTPNINQLVPTSAKGLFSTTRSGSSSFSVYEDVSLLGSITSASATPYNATFSICAANGANFYTTRQISIAGWGSYLSGTQVSALSSAITTYLSAIGVS